MIECAAHWASTTLLYQDNRAVSRSHLMRNGDFRDGNYDTGLLDRLISAGKLELAPPTIRYVNNLEMRRLVCCSVLVLTQ